MTSPTFKRWRTIGTKTGRLSSRAAPIHVVHVGDRVVITEHGMACQGERGSVIAIGTNTPSERKAPVRVRFDDGSEESFWHSELRAVCVVDALAELA